MHVRWGYMNKDIDGIMEQALDGIGRKDVTQFRNIVNKNKFDSQGLFTNSFVTPILRSKCNGQKEDKSL